MDVGDNRKPYGIRPTNITNLYNIFHEFKN